MYKGKKWLLEGLDGIFDSIDYSIETNKYVYLAEEVDNLVEQLEEPLMLTKEWIDSNMDYADNISENSLKDVAVVPVYKLKGLVIEEKEKVVIPKFVADYIERSKQKGYKLIGVMLYFYVLGIDSDDINKYINENYETFVRAWINDDYEIEKEPRWIVFYVNDKNKCFKDFNGINGLIYGGFEEAIKFENKEKAEAVALLTDGEIEEVCE